MTPARIALALTLALALPTGIALAKEGVKDPGVKKRVQAMEGMAMNMKLLANMAKGRMDFSPQDAGDARAAILAGARQIPALFQPHDMDPASDARPAIWTDGAGFAKDADALRLAAERVDTDTQDGLQTSLGQLGDACKTCHQAYRN